VSSFDDDVFEMPRLRQIDDDTIEALLAGTLADPAFEGVASFISEVRSATDGATAPAPSAALASLLSGVSGPAPQETEPSTFRRWTMKTKAYLAGLGLAAKIALGAGLAAAATTGAGAAGVLPGSVQHSFSQAVEAVTPFAVPDGGSGHDAQAPSSTPPAEPVAAVSGPAPAVGTESPAPTEPPATPPTTVAPAPTSDHHDPAPAPAPTPTADQGSSAPATTEPPTATPAPVPEQGTVTSPTPDQPAGADNNNPEAITLTCRAAHEPSGTQVRCSWTASPNADHAKYVLLRTTSDGQPGRVVDQTADGLQYTDTTVSVGTTYGYRIVSLRADGSVDSHSNLVTVTP